MTFAAYASVEDLIEHLYIGNRITVDYGDFARHMDSLIERTLSIED